MPHLKPVGHQSTNWMVRLVLIVLRHDITTLHQAHSHLFVVMGITLGEHRSRLEHRIGGLAHSNLLVIRLISRDDSSIS